MSPNTCASCGKQGELKLGYCHNCAEAESIIREGLDLSGKDINGVKGGHDSKSATRKLKFLIKKGWGNSGNNDTCWACMGKGKDIPFGKEDKPWKHKVCEACYGSGQSSVKPMFDTNKYAIVPSDHKFSPPIKGLYHEQLFINGEVARERLVWRDIPAEPKNIVKTCGGLDCPERNGGRCTAGERASEANTETGVTECECVCHTRSSTYHRDCPCGRGPVFQPDPTEPEVEPAQVNGIPVEAIKRAAEESNRLQAEVIARYESAPTKIPDWVDEGDDYCAKCDTAFKDPEAYRIHTKRHPAPGQSEPAQGAETLEKTVHGLLDQAFDNYNEYLTNDPDGNSTYEGLRKAEGEYFLELIAQREALARLELLQELKRKLNWTDGRDEMFETINAAIQAEQQRLGEGR